MTFFDHFERGERLLGLIVIVELPRQVGNKKENDRQRTNDPKRPPVLQKMPGAELLHDFSAPLVAPNDCPDRRAIATRDFQWQRREIVNAGLDAA